MRARSWMKIHDHPGSHFYSSPVFMMCLDKKGLSWNFLYVDFFCNLRIYGDRCFIYLDHI
jgi:hypothetical protein